MAGNRSLDEFAGQSSGVDAEPDDAPAGGDRGEDAPADGTDGGAAGGAGGEAGSIEEAAAAEAGVEPVAATFAWRPGGEPCPACGETVERRWRDGGALVCVACKDW